MPTPPRLRVTSVTIGTSQPRELAHFYSRLLGLPVTTEDGPGPGEPDNGGWAQIRPPEHVTAPSLSFEYERSYTRPVWPSVSGEQTASQHLDIEVDDLPAAVEWAVACGAVLAEFQPQDNVRVLLDPDGHPFCLFL
ncbi:VOC family protein [Nonomuraea turkmeniaca]|uniref:VOC family protein n=1 Tax=Nonomuraea turkmeniaca TaxID=103838 RepID=A0A5S4EXG8_9ACTN|nr:VOC family protein [Nonomuraea turkmeniaca]TMR08334.1 VOC family protein [Nonomuraea turkmeniaca]